MQTSSVGLVSKHSACKLTHCTAVAAAAAAKCSEVNGFDCNSLPENGVILQSLSFDL